MKLIELKIDDIEDISLTIPNIDKKKERKKLRQTKKDFFLVSFHLFPFRRSILKGDTRNRKAIIFFLKFPLFPTVALSHWEFFLPQPIELFERRSFTFTSKSLFFSIFFFHSFFLSSSASDRFPIFQFFFFLPLLLSISPSSSSSCAHKGSFGEIVFMLASSSLPFIVVAHIERYIRSTAMKKKLLGI